MTLRKQIPNKESIYKSKRELGYEMYPNDKDDFLKANPYISLFTNKTELEGKSLVKETGNLWIADEYKPFEDDGIHLGTFIYIHSKRKVKDDERVYKFEYNIHLEIVGKDEEGNTENFDIKIN